VARPQTRPPLLPYLSADWYKRAAPSVTAALFPRPFSPFRGCLERPPCPLCLSSTPTDQSAITATIDHPSSVSTALDQFSATSSCASPPPSPLLAVGLCRCHHWSPEPPPLLPPPRPLGQLAASVRTLQPHLARCHPGYPLVLMGKTSSPLFWANNAEALGRGRPNTMHRDFSFLFSFKILEIHINF
jgi:hypothetical protein